MKFRLLLIIPALFLMAFTDAKVSTRNAESMQASLQTMLQPLSQQQRLELMDAFFIVANNNDKLYEGGWPKTPRYFSNIYVAEGRVGGDYKRSNGYGHIKGITRQESIIAFISRNGANVNGKSGHQLLAEAKSIVERNAGRTSAADSAASTGQAADMEVMIRRYSRNIPDRRQQISNALDGTNHDRAKDALSRGRLVKVNHMDVLRTTAFVSFDLDLNGHAVGTTSVVDYGVYIHPKGTNYLWPVRGTAEVRPGQNSRSLRVTTEEFEIEFGAQNWPKNVSDYDFYPYVWQITEGRRTRKTIAKQGDIPQYLKSVGYNPSSMSQSNDGIPTTHCEAAIAQAKVALPKMKAGVGFSTLDLDMWNRAEAYCVRGVETKGYGTQTLSTPFYVPRGTAWAAALGSQATPTTPPEVSDRLSNALGYARITKVHDMHVSNWAGGRRIKAHMEFAIHNVSQEPARDAYMGVLVQLRSDPSQYMFLNVTSGRFKESVNTNRIIEFNKKVVSGTSRDVEWISSNPNDYIFTPYVAQISYFPEPKEVYVQTKEEIRKRIMGR